MRKAKYKSGFSLVEAMMATVVLMMATTGVLLPFTSGTRVRIEGTRRTLAANLATDLAEVIVDTPFDQIISAYDGYSDDKGQLRDLGGTLFAGANYANFSRDSSCTYVYVPQQTGSGSASFILATVRVYYDDKLMASINRLIGR